MRLMTTSELAGKSENELADMFRCVSLDLTRTRRHTPERRNGLATLENITRARRTLMCSR